MKERKCSMLLVVLFLFFVGCGSSTVESSGTPDNNSSGPNQSDGSTSITSDGEAIAGAVFDTSFSSAQISTTEGTKAKDESVQLVNESIVKIITDIAVDEFIYELEAEQHDKAPSVVINSDSVTVTFTDERYDVGSGYIILNGTFSFNKTSATDFEVNADMAVSINDVETTMNVNGTDYTETVNGNVRQVFSGSFIATFDETDAITSMEQNLHVQVTGENITVQGTVNGTVTNANFELDMSGDILLGQFNAQCSGSITVSIPSGTQTCNIRSDCTGCIY